VNQDTISNWNVLVLVLKRHELCLSSSVNSLRRSTACEDICSESHIQFDPDEGLLLMSSPPPKKLIATTSSPLTSNTAVGESIEVSSSGESSTIEDGAGMWNVFKLSWSPTGRSRSVDIQMSPNQRNSKKKVKFAPDVAVILIPSLRDLGAADRGLVWWSSDEMKATKREAVVEIMAFMKETGNVDSKFAIKSLWS
jgi:hypothetical protein